MTADAGRVDQARKASRRLSRRGLRMTIDIVKACSVFIVSSVGKVRRGVKRPKNGENSIYWQMFGAAGRIQRLTG
ncbi:MAG: hypothetical protein BroJett007_15460 [Chloroflexota bacterium]|nr:MAG: hypothetical protein BroJett007_15460 [Chloroflexota bacterium]